MTTLRAKILFTGWVCGLLSPVPAVSAEAPLSLVPPPGYFAAVKVKSGGKSNKSCDDAPKPFTGVLDFPSKYEGSGPARDQLNPAATAEYKRLTASITAMEKLTANTIKSYMATGSPAALECSLDLLSSWAEAHALENDARNHAGRALRKWALGSLAGAYLHLKFSSSAPLKGHGGQAETIEQWFVRLGEKVMLEWPTSAPLDRFNNHYYWSGWSLMAAGVATSRRDFFNQSLAEYRVFEKQVRPDGALPNELKRASRALRYHAYALTPLAMIAVFAKANQIDLASEGDGALSRLAALVASGNSNPKHVEILAGTRQEFDASDTQAAWSWLEPYCAAVAACPPDYAARLNASRPFAVTRLGGDLTAVFSGGGS